MAGLSASVSVVIILATFSATVCTVGLDPARAGVSHNDIQDVTNVILRMLTPLALDVFMNVKISTKCSLALMRMMTGAQAKQGWALKFLTSNGMIPSGILYIVTGAPGHYDQCVRAESPPKGSVGRPQFTGKYCSLYLSLPPEIIQQGLNLSIGEGHMNTFVGSLDYDEDKTSKQFLIGICIPSTCSAEEVSGILSHLASRYEIGITVKGCRTLKDEDDRPSMYYIAMYTLIGLIILTSVSTFAQMRGWFNPGSVGCIFSLVANNNYLLAPVKEDTAALAFLNGLKAVLVFWIVLTHTYIMLDASAVYTFKEAFSSLNTFFGQIAVNGGLLAVTSFFFISGFLLIRSLASPVLLPTQSPMWLYVLTLARRYIRVIIPSSFVVLFASVVRVWAHGPFTDGYFESVTGSCDTSWWRVLTCTNNVVAILNSCWVHLWYVSADIQLYAMMTAIAFFMIRRPERACAVTVICVTISCLWIVYVTHANNLLPGVVAFLDSATFQRYINGVHVSSITHAGDFALGMLSGVLYLHAGEARISTWLRGVSSAICFTVMTLILQGPHMLHLLLPGSRWIELIFAGLHRTLWSQACGWLILLMATNNLRWLSSILSAHPLVVLGRLSFCTYLVHLPLIAYFMGSSTVPVQVAHPQMMRMAIGNYVLSVSLAYILHMLIEAPLFDLDKACFGSSKDEAIPKKHHFRLWYTKQRTV